MRPTTIPYPESKPRRRPAASETEDLDCGLISFLTMKNLIILTLLTFIISMLVTRNLRNQNATTTAPAMTNEPASYLTR